MFILYAIPLGVVAGYLLGGRLDRLADLHFRWGWLAMAGLLIQVLLFSEAAAGIVGRELGAVIYVASTAAVLVAVLRNLRLPGVVLVALGAAGNLAAILANGGVMPTTEAALATAGLEDRAGLSNSAVVADPALAPLINLPMRILGPCKSTSTPTVLPRVRASERTASASCICCSGVP